jgi:hypothetical protein
MTKTDPAAEFLSFLELKEETLLAWGLSETEISADELAAYADDFIQDLGSGFASDDLIKQLLKRKLLFHFSRSGRKFYRTRMSETVRLLACLRQWLPRRDWRTAPNLVADYRLSLRRRTYPQRNIPALEFVARLQGEAALSPEQRDLLLLLTGTMNLADFQYIAAKQLLNDARQRQSYGMIVGAGTGTGKTLAFYLPALATIIPLIRSREHWTKLIAIYPRNELLKDQMSEVFRLARLASQISLPSHGRKVRIGCFYGDTPKEPSVNRVLDKKWRMHPSGDGYVCTYLRCPVCEEEVIWPLADLRDGRQRLRCTRASCDFTAIDDEIVLTRDAIRTAPPDILFTSTEMLNRVISDGRYAGAFGVGDVPSPRLVLLDEVHTYCGTSGAQVGLLLRRWRHASGGNPHFTGLSATLRDAASFLSQLTGLAETRITAVVPGADSAPGEMTQEGMEYRVALRGDPVSETATLSTTVQAAMLMRRVLDPPDHSPSLKAYGKRLFAFCDDLDIVNRLYNILRDAEGWQQAGPPRLPLAALRSRTPQSAKDNEGLRFLNGQSWRLCEDIGHDLGLKRNLRIARTSSQDPGVDPEADIVVATASLEVGFNDPEVGAVLQHKAPRDMASFLQRRGRAGRIRAMRPWTVVVLSDYGRDRTAYQAYDALFDPELQSRHLPVSNRYVLRMQAVFAFLDWMARQIVGKPGVKPCDIWRDFAEPAKVPYRELRRPRQQAELEVILDLIDGDDAVLNSLEDWLERALQIGADEVTALLWEPPRGLMTEVLPTLYRRLDTEWRRVPHSPGDSTVDYIWNGNPLPEFAPPNLFTDLNLPEVRIIARQSPRGRELERSEPILRAMQILAPGKVTRRFAVEQGFVSHWIPPADRQALEQTLSLTAICSAFQDLGEFQSVESGQLVSRRCIRPIEMRPQIVPQGVSSTSNSNLEWRTQIHPVGTGREVEPSTEPSWVKLVPWIKFFLHNHHSHALVRRFAIGADAEIKTRGGSTAIRIDFCEADRRPAAVGFALTADGIHFRVRLPAVPLLRSDDPNRDKLRAWRTAFFRHRLHESDALRADVNHFVRDRLCDAYLSALQAHSLMNGVSLAESNRFLQSGPEGREEVEAVLSVIFQTLDADLDEATESEDHGGAQLGRMHLRLLRCLRDDRILTALGNEARVLWLDPDADWETWARDRLLSTLGRALLDAANRLCPEFDAKDLLLDLDSGPPIPGTPPLAEDEREIWITEGTIGGAGAIEEIFRQYTANPRRFWELALAALDPSDFEEVDVALRGFIEGMGSDADLRETVAAVRQAEGLDETRRAAERLRRILLQRGYTPHHALLTALQSRILRPGSSERTDALLGKLVRLIEAQEDATGIEMDMRVFAYVASRDRSIKEAFDAIPDFGRGDDSWRCSVIYGLLWPHGNAIRSRALYYGHPFAEQAPAERSLLQDFLSRAEAKVAVSDPAWKTALAAALNSSGMCRLLARFDQRDQLSQALLELAVEPVELDALLLYPSVGRVRQDNGTLEVLVQVKEAI